MSFMNLATAEKEKIVEIGKRNDIEFCAFEATNFLELKLEGSVG